MELVRQHILLKQHGQSKSAAAIRRVQDLETHAGMNSPRYYTAPDESGFVAMQDRTGPTGPIFDVNI